MDGKQLGKIKSARFGAGGYDDAMIGITFDLGGEGWGIGDFWGWWMHRSESAQWSEQSRIVKLGEMAMKVSALLIAAKKTDIARLAGTPIEIEIEGNCLKSWRVLTEVV